MTPTNLDHETAARLRNVRCRAMAPPLAGRPYPTATVRAIASVLVPAPGMTAEQRAAGAWLFGKGR